MFDASIVVLASDVTSPFNPASPQARSVNSIFILTGAVMAVVLSIVCGWILYIVLHFRGKPGEPDPTPVYGNTKLEITWTIIPLLIVTLLTILMYPAMMASRPAIAADARPDVVIIGHQWWWEIRYSRSGLVTANELHMPVDEPWLVQLRAADVIHDFWVPQLGPKEDMVPTQINHIWLQPSQPGTYDGSCAEFCGNDHGWMRIRVIAQTKADFEAWQSAQLQAVPQPQDARAQAGERLLTQNTCLNCHAINGISGADETVAPDLTNLADRETLGAGSMVNSRENLALWLTDPQRYKPGSYMPNFHLSKEDVDALTAYLWHHAPRVASGAASSPSAPSASDLAPPGAVAPAPAAAESGTP